MRILMLSYHTCPLASVEGKETGGMNIYVHELSRELGKLGHAVDVFTRSSDPDNEKTVAVSDNYRVIHIDAGPQESVPKKTLMGYIPEFTDNLRKYIASDGRSYDIIHSHYYQSGLITQRMKRILGGTEPTVISFHTLGLMKNLVARSPVEEESRERIDTEFMLAERSNAVIASSGTDAEYLNYLYGVPKTKIIEIPPGVNTELFRPMDKNRAKQRIGTECGAGMILYVGRIEPLKGIDELLYALKIMVSRNPSLPVCLVIVGGDISQHIEKWSAPLKKLRRILQTLDIGRYVRFVGQKPQHELADYYNAADVVVMPSHYESFGIAAYEAISCKTPVVTTNVTGVSHLLTDDRNGLISSVNNPLLLASQIERILSDRDRTVKPEVSSVSAPIRGWDDVARQTADEYTRLIQTLKG